MRTLHTSARFGGSVDLYELVDTPDGEPLGATHIGTVVTAEGGFTHGKVNNRVFESQGKALMDLALAHYNGMPDFVLDAMPELMGPDAFDSAMKQIFTAAMLSDRSALAAEKAKERWGK